MVRFFGQHELGRAGQGVKRTFSQCAQLVFTIAVGEIGEHEEAQPVRRLLVEGLQDAGVVVVATATLKQSFSFFAAIASEMFVQQIHHRPKVTPFFHINLKEIAQVVHARRSQPQVALLLNRCWLCIALRHDDATQVGAVFARHVLPNALALVIAKVDLALLIAWVHKNSPAVVTHLHVTELRPPLRVDAHGCAQINVHIGRAFRAHIVPPVDEVGLPLLQCALQGAVTREVDVIRDFFAVVDACHGVLQCG